MWSKPWSDLITVLHNQSRPTVLVTTGGGASAISELLAVPGASRTVLDAHVPYSSEALIEWLGRRPDQFCEERTALAMASVAAFRARKLLDSAHSQSLATSTARLLPNRADMQDQLSPSDSKEVMAPLAPVIGGEGRLIQLTHPDTLHHTNPNSGHEPPSSSLGVSCTASLASDRPKRGNHRCFIAVQTPHLTASWWLILEKGVRSRAEEETLVGQLIVLALADSCGITDLPTCDLRPSETLHRERQIPSAELAAVWSGTADCLWSLPNGTLADQPAVAPCGLLCGAFDPVHRGHEELRLVAERRLGGPVAYEMSITNVDKPPLDFLTIERRRRQFQDVPLALTNAPRFWQKARIFPGTTFVVGSDTAARILEVKYYGGDDAALAEALENIREAGCRFLVASRLVDGNPLSLDKLNVPATVRDLFEAIPEPEFRVDISSTQLRRKE